MGAITTKAPASTPLRAHSAPRHDPAVRLSPRSAFATPIVVQRQGSCACGGGCPRCEGESALPDDRESALTLPIQTKLAVNAPGDVYEHEADRVADHVMRLPMPSLVAMPPATAERQAEEPGQEAGEDATPTLVQTMPLVLQRVAMVQRQVEERAEEEEEVFLQRQVDGEVLAPPDEAEDEDENEAEEPIAEMEDVAPIQMKRGPPRAPPDHSDESTSPQTVENRLRQRAGRGVGLSVPVRGSMEAHFGLDFSRVRVHADGEADHLSRALQAHAFTTGHDIYFAAGQYAPGTAAGDRLLAHELTHVVQQTGGTAGGDRPPRAELAVQRALDDAKSYTGLGNWAHYRIETALRGEKANNSGEVLITEAPIPGGTRERPGLNLVGFADLYKAKGNIVPGVRAKQRSEETGLEDKDRTLDYENMPGNTRNPAARALTKFSAYGSIQPKGQIDYGPTIVKRVWRTPPDFPETFWVGELKPLFPLADFTLPALGTGISQVANYTQGLEAFVKKAHADNGGVTRASTSGQQLTGLHIPAAIDYRQFDTQHATAGTGAILRKPAAKSTQRIWVYPLQDGLYVYFLIPHPYSAATYPAALDTQLQQLDPLLRELRERQPTIPGRLDVSRKAAPEAVRSSALPGRLVIQRTPRPALDQKWDKRAKDWEAKRALWDKGRGGKGGAREFIKGEGKGPIKRAKVDSELHLPAGTGPGRVPQEGAKLKKIQLWSGTSGRILGWLRFRFGDLFDRVGRLFQRIREKFQSVHKKSGTLNEKGGIFSDWKKTATRVIIRIGVRLLQELLVQAFAAFAACANGMINKVIDRFFDDANEKLREELEPVTAKVEKFQKELETRYGIRIADLATFVDAVESIKAWVNILSSVETGVRIGVQIVSCGSPPGLGCLWGLVAQFAIGEGLELLADTNYFENRIAAPAARSLVDSIAGDALRNLVAASVEAAELQKYAEGVGECAPRKTVSAAGGGGDGPFDPNAPDVVRAREAWERKYHDKLMKDIIAAFQKESGGTGKPASEVTAADIEKLVEQMKKSGLTPDKMKDVVQRARDAKTGQINITAVAAALEAAATGAAPAAGAPEAPGVAGEEAGVPEYETVVVGKRDVAPPVLDASKTAPPPESGKPATNWRAQINALGGHTRGAKPLVWAWIYRDGTHVLTLSNVATEVVARTWYPSSEKRESLRVHYKILRAIPLDPYFPGVTLRAGATIYGYIKATGGQ